MIATTVTIICFYLVLICLILILAILVKHVSWINTQIYILFPLLYHHFMKNIEDLPDSETSYRLHLQEYRYLSGMKISKERTFLFANMVRLSKRRNTPTFTVEELKRSQKLQKFLDENGLSTLKK